MGDNEWAVGGVELDEDELTEADIALLTAIDAAPRGTRVLLPRDGYALVVGHRANGETLLCTEPASFTAMCASFDQEAA